MTIVLGIDTATSGCSAALIRDETCLAAIRERMTRGQSEALTPMIDDVVRRAGVTFGDIDAMAVTRGPGAFTGLRIGIATARALALAVGKPCLGIGTFEALRAEAADAGAMAGIDALVVGVDSKREEQFVAVFGADGALIGEPAALTPDAVAGRLTGLERLAVVGDAADVLADALRPAFDVNRYPEIDLPDPTVVARLGLEALSAPQMAPATPLYFRPPDVTLPKR